MTRSEKLLGGFILLCLFLLMCLMSSLFIGKAYAGEGVVYFSYEQIADAVFMAEGGYKAQYLYGIKSIPYGSEAEARQICVNSVRNNVIRWYRAGKPGDFWSFMRNRYAPLSDAEVNKYWVKNVKYFLTKGGAR